MAKFDPYRKWLGIPPSEQPPNHYRLLGIGLFESDQDVISNAADRQMAHVRTFQSGKYSTLSQRILNELSGARVCLLDAEQRVAYETRLRAELAATAAATPAQPARNSGPPPPRSAAPAASQADSGPAMPQVATGRATFSTTTRSSTYAGRRKKKASWQGPVITVTAVLVSLALVALAINNSGSETPNKQGNREASNGNGKKPVDQEENKPPRKRRQPGNGRRVSPTPVPDRVGEIRAFLGHTGPVVDAAISSNGLFILSGSEDNTVRLWDVSKGTDLRHFEGATDPIVSVAFSGDAKTVLASSGQLAPSPGGHVHVWNTGEAQATLRVDVSKSGVALDAIFSPDGKHLLLACGDATLRLLDAITQAEIRQFTGHEGPVRCVAFSADGSRILSGGDDRTVRLWDAATGKQLQSITGHQGPVTGVAFAPNGESAISGSLDKTVRYWDLETGAQKQECMGHLDKVTCVAYSPEGPFALSGGGEFDGTIRLWKLSDGTEVQILGRHLGGVRSVAFSADGRRAVSAGNDAVVRLWGVPDLSLPFPSPGSGDQPGDATPDAGVPQPLRLAVPDEPSRKKAEEVIRNEVFKADFAEADRPSKQTALVQKLLAEGVKPQEDPAYSYVLLRLAGNAATRLGDADTALTALDELDQRFEIDTFAEKTKALRTVAELTKSTPRKRVLVETILGVLDDAEAADDFKAAELLTLLAGDAVAGARDGPLSKRVTTRAMEIQELQKKYQEVEQALEVLQTRADDPRANQTVGRYYCLVKGQWERGLPHLAASADGQLKTLALAEAENPETVPERLNLAKGWWEAAEAETGPAKQQLRRQAARWYKLVEPDLADGVEKTWARQRLSEAGEADAAIDPATVPKFVALECREEAIRPTLLKAFGGTDASENAVDRALTWLDVHQNANGSWSFDHTGPRCQDRCPDKGTLTEAHNAATALVLLPYLGAGNGPRKGTYRKNVAMGMNFLKQRIQMFGTLYEPGAGQMPSHALGTIALCEAAVLSKDRRTLEAAQLGVNFIVATQNTDGGWGTKPSPPEPLPGPSGVYTTGWNLAALQTAKWAELSVSPRALQQAGRYLSSMRVKDAPGYLHDAKGTKADATATAVAVLSQMYLGWQRDKQELADYVAERGQSGPSTGGHFYLNYYNSQIVRHYGGMDWDKWNTALRDHLVATQATDDHAAGSWYLVNNGWSVKNGGRVFCTALAALMLEVYYRHPPLYQ